MLSEQDTVGMLGEPDSLTKQQISDLGELTSTKDTKSKQYFHRLENFLKSIQYMPSAKMGPKFIQEKAEKLWLEYSKSVSDPDVVYLHMHRNQIAIQNAKLYTKWASFYEKYLREYEASALVLQEGLDRIPEKDSKALLSYFQDFGDRMQQRYTRDFKDELGPLFDNLAIQEQPNQKQTKLNGLKRTLLQAFDPSEREIHSKTKRHLRSKSKEVVECHRSIQKYQKGTEIREQLESQHGIKFEKKTLTKNDMDELMQKPVCWITQDKRQRERQASRRKNLDVITEKSYEADTVKESTLLNDSAQSLHSVDASNKVSNEVVQSKQRPVQSSKLKVVKQDDTNQSRNVEPTFEHKLASAFKRQMNDQGVINCQSMSKQEIEYAMLEFVQGMKKSIQDTNEGRQGTLAPSHYQQTTVNREEHDYNNQTFGRPAQSNFAGKILSQRRFGSVSHQSPSVDARDLTPRQKPEIAPQASRQFSASAQKSMFNQLPMFGGFESGVQHDNLPFQKSVRVDASPIELAKSDNDQSFAVSGTFRNLINMDHSAIDYKKRSSKPASSSAFNFATPEPATPAKTSSIFDSAQPLRKSNGYANKENSSFNSSMLFMPVKIYQEKQKRQEEASNQKQAAERDEAAKKSLISAISKGKDGFTDAPYIRQVQQTDTAAQAQNDQPGSFFGLLLGKGQEAQDCNGLGNEQGSKKSCGKSVRFA